MTSAAELAIVLKTQGNFSAPFGKLKEALEGLGSLGQSASKAFTTTTTSLFGVGAAGTVATVQLVGTSTALTATAIAANVTAGSALLAAGALSQTAGAAVTLKSDVDLVNDGLRETTKQSKKAVEELSKVKDAMSEEEDKTTKAGVAGTMVSKLGTAITALGAAIALVAPPLGAFVAALGSIASAAGFAITHLSDLKNFVENLANKFDQLKENIIKAIRVYAEFKAAGPPPSEVPAPPSTARRIWNWITGKKTEEPLPPPAPEVPQTFGQRALSSAKSIGTEALGYSKRAFSGLLSAGILSPKVGQAATEGGIAGKEFSEGFQSVARPTIQQGIKSWLGGVGKAAFEGGKRAFFGVLSHSEAVKEQNEVEKATERAGREMQESAPKVSLFSRALSGLGSVAHGTLGILGRIKNTIFSLKSIALGLATSFGVLTAIQLSASMEQNRIAFETFLGSARAADKFLGELEDFASRTPFEFTELTQAARRLKAFGFEAKEVIPMMSSIGDAVSGLGRGQEGIQRVILALGQMKAKGKVSGEEMRQLTEVGIAGWKYIAEGFGISVPEAMKKSERGVLDVNKGIQYLLAGMAKEFPNMMEKQSQTLNGLWSTVMDNVKITGTKAGDAIVKAFDLKQRLKDAISFLQNIGPTVLAATQVISALATGAGFDALFASLNKAFGKETTNQIKEFLVPLMKFRTETLPGIVEAIAPVASAIGSGFIAIFKAIPPVFKAIGRAIDIVVGAIQDLAKVISENKVTLTLFIGVVTFVASNLAILAGSAAIGGVITAIKILAAAIVTILVPAFAAITIAGFPVLVPLALISAAIAILVTDFKGLGTKAVKHLGDMTISMVNLFGVIIVSWSELVNQMDTKWTSFITDAIRKTGWFGEAIAEIIDQPLGPFWSPKSKQSLENMTSAIEDAKRRVESFTGAGPDIKPKDLFGADLESSFADAMQNVTTISSRALDELFTRNPKIKELVDKLQEAALATGGLNDKTEETPPAAEKAKTALEELGISASTVKKALELLDKPFDLIDAALLALGEEAINLGPQIEELGVSVAKLGAAFGAAGLPVEWAEQVKGILDMKKAEEEAKKAAEELKQAHEDAAAAVEAHRQKYESMTDTIMGRLTPAFQRLYAAVGGGFTESQIGSFTGSVEAILGAGTSNARTAAGIKLPGFAGGVSNFKGGLAVVGERGPELVNLPGGSDVIPNGGSGQSVQALKDVAQAHRDAAKAIEDHAKSLRGTAEGQAALEKILGTVAVKIAKVAMEFNNANFSAEKAASVLGGLAEDLVALTQVGGDTEWAVSGINDSLDVLGEKFKFLTGAELASAGALMDASRELVKAFQDGSISAEQFKFGIENLEGPLSMLGQSADKAGESLTKGFTDKLKEGMNPLLAVQATFRDAAKGKWIEGLEGEVQKRFAAINAAMAQGPEAVNAEIEKSKDLFRTYTEALRGTTEEIQAMAREQERLAAIQERANNAVSNFTQELQSKDFWSPAKQQSWEKSMFGNTLANLNKEAQIAIRIQEQDQRAREEAARREQERLGALKKTAEEIGRAIEENITDQLLQLKFNNQFDNPFKPLQLSVEAITSSLSDIMQLNQYGDVALNNDPKNPFLGMQYNNLLSTAQKMGIPLNVLKLLVKGRLSRPRAVGDNGGRDEDDWYDAWQTTGLEASGPGIEQLSPEDLGMTQQQLSDMMNATTQDARYAAEGAVTNRPTRLITSENYQTELTTPEDMLRRIIREEAGSRRSGDIVIQVNGRELFRIMSEELNESGTAAARFGI